MRKFRTAILVSGSGSNLQAIIDANGPDTDFPADLRLVISNNPEAYGLTRAENAKIQTLTINHRNFGSREDFDTALHAALVEQDIELVCLAGFMRILTPQFVQDWSGRMLNIHPSLLPAFRGNRAQEQVLESSVTLSGCTVHEVVPDLDAGPIVGQAAVPRLADDTLDTLSERVRQAEHMLYPLAIRSFLGASVEPPALLPPQMIISLNKLAQYAPASQ